MAAAVASSARIRAAPVAALLAGIALAACDSGLPAQGQEPHDFYVLAISWSPSYCAAEGDSANRGQCEARPGHGYVVHGLWPQYEEGWPEFCEPGDEAWVADDLVSEMLDIMPSPGLVGHQWRKHGSCSGLSQEDYFALTRAAFDRITLPSPSSATVAPDDLERSVIELNDGLQPGAMAVTCDGEFLREIRICMEADLEFRPCPEVASRACTLDTARMPPVPR